MEKKREVSILIPYKIKDREIFVYLQKRSMDRKVLPGHFAFFGGKLEEGENSNEALEREIKEELGFLPEGYQFLGDYQFIGAVAHAYFLKVNENFESQIKVMEGDYGKFFSENEMIKETMMIDSDKNILKNLYKLLNRPTT